LSCPEFSKIKNIATELKSNKTGVCKYIYIYVKKWWKKGRNYCNCQMHYHGIFLPNSSQGKNEKKTQSSA